MTGSEGSNERMDGIQSKKPLQRLDSEAAIGPMQPPPMIPMSQHGPVLEFFKRTTALWICVVYVTISGSLILVNKHVMVDDGFHFPWTVAFMGMASSSLFSFVACKRYGYNAARGKIDFHFYLRNMMPIGFCMAATLHLGNLSYFYLSVSFIQMLKATTPIMVMIALFVAKMERPSVALIASVCVIAAGTAVASIGQVNLSGLGLFIVLTAEMLEAIKLVMMQKLLVGLEFHPIEGLMYLAPACCFWLGLGLVLFEASRILDEGALLLVLRKPVLYAFSAVMGFFVNLTAYMVIKATSSLMLKILGTIKTALLVTIATFLLAETVTWLQFVGYAMSLMGFWSYNKVKAQQAQGAALAALQQQQQQAARNRPGSILNPR